MSDNLNEFGALVPKHLAEALLAENARLKAEVERLTKAANWVLLQWDANQDGGETSRVGSNSIKELRNAVKEGESMWGVVAPYVVPPCIDKYTAKEGKQFK
jgi:hypothetical protein